MFGLPPARTRRVLRFFLVLIPAAAIALAAGYALIPRAPAPSAQAKVWLPALAQDSRAATPDTETPTAAERVESAPAVAVPASYDSSADVHAHDQRSVSARPL